MFRIHSCTKYDILNPPIQCELHALTPAVAILVTTTIQRLLVTSVKYRDRECIRTVCHHLIIGSVLIV
uniref:Ovule protein n=1 Tax=Haemonchus contortus TaxID=6289 RepID=A0A7I4Y621_HAECO|nr:unnamed protein product [Haemonchus contortus]